MPTYEYRCFTCDKTVSEVRSIHADANYNPPCPQCSKPMPRLYTSPPVNFRGSGWGKNR